MRFYNSATLTGFISRICTPVTSWECSFQQILHYNALIGVSPEKNRHLYVDPQVGVAMLQALDVIISSQSSSKLITDSCRGIKVLRRAFPL